MQKLLTFFFSKNISIYAIFNDQSFNDTLTNDTISFEQLCLGDFNRLNMVGFHEKVRNFNIFWLKKKKKKSFIKSCAIYFLNKNIMKTRLFKYIENFTTKK